MSFRKTLHLFTLIVALSSCHAESSSDYHDFTPTILSKDSIDLSSKLFFMGPQIDTLKMDIRADCDCCASNLAFVNNKVFVFESLCLEGDDYFKGIYFKFKNLVFLKFNPMMVSSIHYPGENMETTWEKASDSVSYSLLHFSTLKSEWVLSASYYGSDTDYGMCNRTISVKKFLERLKSEDIWSKLELSDDLE
jgi:hypothetical protein